MNKEEIKAMIKDCVYSEDGITYMSDKQYNNYINIIEQLQQENQKLKKQLEEYKLITINYQELQQENQELKERINKAINYVSSNDIEVLKYHDVPSETTSYEIVTVDLLKILRGESNE